MSKNHQQPQQQASRDVFARPPPPPPPAAAAPPRGQTTTPTLQRLSSSGSGSVADHPLSNVEQQQWQHPTIASTPIVSPAKTLDDLADDFLSRPSSRTTERGLPPVLAPDPLPAAASELERLKILVARRAWADVLLMSSQLLRGSQSHYAPLYDSLLHNKNAELALQTHQEDLVYILTVFCHALVKLGNYRELQPELKKWRFCHHNDNTAPSWIPWSLHIKAATCLRYVVVKDDDENKSADEITEKAFTDCLDALWAIRDDIPQEDVNAKMQVENALANVFVAKGDWRMALECLQRMIDMLPTAYPAGSGDVGTVQVAYRAELLSRQGRILLQAGAVDQASVVFERAASIWNEIDILAKHNFKDYVAVQHIPAQLAVNEGLLKFSQGKYDEAMELFRTAMNHLRLSFSQGQAQDDYWVSRSPITIESRHNLYSEVVNNMSLCAIYTCRLEEALGIMESLVREDPTQNLTDRVALNLCTLYELASDSAASARKKRVLQLIAKRFFLHDIGAECFRVT